MVSGSCTASCVLCEVVSILVLCGTIGAQNTMWQTGHTIVEHLVDHEEARASARTLEPESYVRQPGCEECTKEELEYCTGNAVLHDHCCCDRRHLEKFPYVPHTCYLKPDCRPLAGDCSMYTRLRVCCCDRFVAEKWKSDASQPYPWRTLLLCIVAIFRVL